MKKTYPADWNELDKRPVPQWYSDAKFGIFIHWGLYSVPAWSPRGTYTEWYQYWLQTKQLWGEGEYSGDEVFNHHQNTYGEDYPYSNFARQWKAEQFNPDEWAKLLENAGARYVILTSKHHDGFALWPSKEASVAFNKPWNAVETGPGRDLVGELTEAVRKTGVRMGLYFSLYEWFNQLYLNDPDRYVEEQYLPQFKDLVKQYAPSLIFTDGEWEMDWGQWRSPEFISWLFSNAANRDEVVINDRWGKCRHEHGGYYTTEYGSGLADDRHPWEETRGIGCSFGYNTEEGEQDYKSSRELVLMLIDIVSRGGNFCLNIGPRADGTIIEIMQERLLGVGKWLHTYGNAIYGTRMWKRPCQWSSGKRVETLYPEFDTDYRIFRQTIDPPQGHAVKEVFFTRKGDRLFAITPRLPGKELVIRDLFLPEDAKIKNVADGADLQWKKDKTDIIIDTERITGDDFAHVIELSCINDFVKKPVFSVRYTGPDIEPAVGVFCNTDGAGITYTVNDGTKQSYAGIIPVDPGSSITAVARHAGKEQSDTAQVFVENFWQFPHVFIDGSAGGTAGKLSTESGTLSELTRLESGAAGIKGNSLILTIELEQTADIGSVAFRFIQKPENWIFPPVLTRCSVSDAVGFIIFEDEQTAFVNVNDYKKSQRNIHFTVNRKNVRTVRAEFRSAGKCPSWHFAADKPAWMFLEKVEIHS